VALLLATPFPSLVQLPLDIVVERDPPGAQAAFIGLQAAWVLVILGLCRLVQRRAERRLVIQGG
jgi:ABC-2 type transport system permease protein